MLPVPFLVINDVIVTSLLLLKIIYVSTNSLDFSRDVMVAVTSSGLY